MIALFKNKSFILSIIIIVFIISVGTYVKSFNKNAKKNYTETNNKNTVGAKSASNPLEQPKSQPAPKKEVAPSKTVSSQKIASTSTVTPSKKTVPSSKATVSPSKKTASQTKTTSSQKKVPTSTVTPSKKTVSPAKTVPSASPQKYISNNLGFSVIFPASWRNKYTVKEDNNGLVIKFKPVSNPIAGGMLFEIVKKSSDFNEGMSDGIGKRYITAKGVTYIIGGPMDVGFPPDNPEFSSYRKLASQLSSVALTIKSIN